MTNPAVMFDEVPGYPKGHRVLANILTSVPRINLALGLPIDTPEVALVNRWRDYMRDQPVHAPVEVNGGPLNENVFEGDDIDITTIPSPRWHERDGGYYIGTACMVVMKDPDSGWINYGAYRVQAHDARTASVMVSKGKHGNMIMNKYFDRGERCPIAVVAGMHPALFMVAGLEMPHGANEYDCAGGLLGEGVQIINMPQTGLPVPANAEIAFEGIRGPRRSGRRGAVRRVGGLLRGRHAPGARHPDRDLHAPRRPDPPGRHPGRAAQRRHVLPRHLSLRRGVEPARGRRRARVKGVWAHEAGGSRMWLTVSIKQMYGGHSKQAGMIASQCHAGAYANRWVVVVDDDIDPANMNDVLWAMCTRCDPREGIETIRGGWSTHLDPMCYSHDDRRNARVVVDACKPFARGDDFPAVVRNSAELEARVNEKFGNLFGG